MKKLIFTFLFSIFTTWASFAQELSPTSDSSSITAEQAIEIAADFVTQKGYPMKENFRQTGSASFNNGEWLVIFNRYGPYASTITLGMSHIWVYLSPDGTILNQH